ncbi:hypothetical protein ACES2L_13005 [Bdellovibrio bacteriovorus]
MKHLVYFIFALCLAACQGDGGGGGGKVATAPLGLNCINGQANCDTNQYNQYYQFGWRPYPGFVYGYDYSTVFSQTGFCNCPGGFMPVYNGTYGLGCVEQYYLEPFANAFFYFNFSIGGFVGGGYVGGYTAPQYPTNWPQYSNVGGTVNTCSRTLTQSCFLNQANSCGVGATCRPINNGPLGICSN